MKSIRIGMAQINAVVGALKENTDKAIGLIRDMRRAGVQIAVFPELSVCGYPPEDLLLKPHFIKESRAHLNRIKDASENITVIAGFPDCVSGKVHNSAGIIRNRKIVYIYNKMHLPNYGVFDEKRYFTPGKECAVMSEDGVLWSVNICEDIWAENGNARPELDAAQLIINISASPYHKGKRLEREQTLKRRARKHNINICYCNLTGGQDELVFDGGSLIVNKRGEITARGKQFEEDTIIKDIAFTGLPGKKKGTGRIKRIYLHTVSPPVKAKKLPRRNIKPLPEHTEVYSALVLGTRDYAHKNGFRKGVLGLSGGIDSALSCVIAADALGKENIIGISMPSKFTSASSQKDAARLASNLGIGFITVPIDNIFKMYIKQLRPVFKSAAVNTAEENLQARIRGNILMAVSNKFGCLVFTTGNKSETSVGYCTLYGDMAGGFAILKDVPKQLVYRLARFRNKKEGNGLIPKRIFTKAPTAELRENQKDSDSIPPYSVLDPIIEAYIEKDKSAPQIIKNGADKETVLKITKLIDTNEYKRRQSPPGIKITPKAFGKDRRMPITCSYQQNQGTQY